jgi:hypothetical protein
MARCKGVSDGQHQHHTKRRRGHRALSTLLASLLVIALGGVTAAQGQSAPPVAPPPIEQVTPNAGDDPRDADASPIESPPDPDNTVTAAEIASIQTGDHVGTFILPDAPPRFRGTGLQLTGIRFGWNGRLRAERHTPIWIKFDSGENSVQGTVVLEYTQDASQRAQVIAPFSTTPNAGAVVELVACLPGSTTKLTLRVSDGDATRTIDIGAIPQPDGLLMPTIDTFGLSILGVHEGGANSIVTRLSEGVVVAQVPSNSGPDIQSVFAAASPVSCDPAELAQSWQAYDSIDVFVAREEDLARAPERARDAINTWVRAGGHLVVQVSAAAQTWRQVVPEGVPLEITFAERAESPVSNLMRDRISSGGPSTQPRRDPAPTALMRVARWDAGGPRDGEWSAGWTTRLATPDAVRPPNTSAPQGESPIASGPVGFGRVTLVGVDPARLFGVLDAHATAQAWRAILWDVLPEPVIVTSSQSHDYYGSRTSGATSYERQALSGVLDAITIAAPIGPWFFLVTAGAVGLLVLAVGPLGRMVLRRKGWQRSSWIVALALSGVACMIGLFAPMLVRSGQSITSDLAVHDVICDQKGEPMLHARTNLRAVFSGKPETIAIRDTEGAPEEGRWWRGVSSASLGDAGVPFGSPLTLVLTQPALGVARTAAAMPTSFGQWTYRAFLEQQTASDGRSAPSLRADIRMNDQDSVAVRLRGLDPTRRAVAAWLYTRDGSAVATKLDAISESGVLEAVIDSPALPRSPLVPLSETSTNQHWGQPDHAPSQGQDAMTWYAGMLPGPAQRTFALDQMVFADGPRAFALVVVGLRDAKADAPQQQKGARAAYGFEVVRMIVPVSEDVLRAMRAMQGEMVSPDPAANTAATQPPDANAADPMQPDLSDSPDPTDSPNAPDSEGAPR